MKEVAKNTLKRVLSAAILLPIYLFAIVSDHFYSIPILVISIVVSVACLLEFFNITSKTSGGKPFVKLGLLGALGLNGLFYLYSFGAKYNLVSNWDEKYIMAFVSLFIMVSLVVQVVARKISGSSHALGLLLFGVFFIAFGFSHIILMKALPDGKYYIIILNIVIMINDSGAYFGGVLFGKHKVGFEVSPNKSWEGYFSGLVFSVLAMIGANIFCIKILSKNLFTIPESIIIGLLLSFLANMGDLVESVIKRDNSIKDSGTIIPGHGGMWDTMDAVIFALPAFYYYLVLVKGII